MDALIESLAAGDLDSLQPVIPHAGRDLDHLPVAIAATLGLVPDRSHGLRRNPVPERRAIAQRAPGLRARTGTGCHGSETV